MMLGRISRRAYITITIGTLLLSGAFMVLSLNYANTTGTFYTQRNTPVVVFTTELEALTSLAYSLPEDATIEYSGPHSCVWDENKGKFVCAGGLEIEGVSSDVTFTKDEHILTTPRSACIYVSIGTIWNLIKRAGGKVAQKFGREALEEAVEEGVERAGRETAEKLSTKVRRGVADAIERIRSINQRVGRWWQRVKARFWIRGRGTLAHKLASNYGIGTDEAQNILEQGMRKGLIEIPEEFGDDSARYANKLLNEMADNPSSLTSRATYSYLDEAGQILDGEVTTRMRYTAGFVNQWVAYKGVSEALDMSKSNLARIPEAFHRGVRAKVGYDSCRMNNLFLNVVNFFLGNQILIQVDLDTTNTYYDFYAGKYGAVTVDFNDGFDDIKAAKTYAVNGEDMCFLRKQLSYFGGGYETPELGISDGSVVLSKTKNLFDTLCPEDSEYYPVGVGEIVGKMAQVREGGATEFDVYVTPGRSIAYDAAENRLCEKKVARTETGERSGDFTVFCYDLDNLDFATDVGFTELSINYNIHEGPIFPPDLIPDTNPYLSDIEEKANTYWFDECLWNGRVSFDIPAVSDALKLVLGSDPFQALKQGLSFDVELPCSSQEEKIGFLQTMYYKCGLNASESDGTVTLSNEGCDPLVYMNREDIVTEDYSCGNNVCENWENSADCMLDCEPLLCGSPDPETCAACSEECGEPATCVPFGEFEEDDPDIVHDELCGPMLKTESVGSRQASYQLYGKCRCGGS